MRSACIATLALLLAAAPASGQGSSDSTFIAREWAAWNALKDADSAAFVRAVGFSPSVLYMSGGGLTRASAEEMAGLVTKCDTRSHRLDMFNIVRPTDDTAILAYRVTLDRRCGPAVGRGADVIALQLMSMTVWVRRNSRWQAVAQSVTPLGPTNVPR